MKTKKDDVLYCGVSKEKIESISPILNEENLKHLEFWIKERYKIRTRKDIEKKPFPWTENGILRNYKFTNVKRYHDRETVWLIDNITDNPDLSLEEKVWNCILFRTWNKSETSKILGAPYKKEQYIKGSEHFKSMMDEAIKKNPDHVWFTNAFHTGGIKQTWQFQDNTLKSSNERHKLVREKNIPFRMFFLMDYVNDNKIVEKILESKDQLEAFETLQLIPGVGLFLAYQMFVDFSYILDFKFSENEFTVAGPGCQRGIDRVVEDLNGLSYEELIFWIRDNQKELFSIDFNSLMSDLPEEDRRLTVIDIENAFCEISKYLKTFYNEGRPKVKYALRNRVKNLGLF